MEEWMRLILEEKEKILVQNDFLELEKLIKKPLPAQFKKFYLVNNG